MGKKWTKVQREKFNASLVARGLTPRGGKRRKNKPASGGEVQEVHLPLDAIPDKVRPSKKPSRNEKLIAYGRYLAKREGVQNYEMLARLIVAVAKVLG